MMANILDQLIEKMMVKPGLRQMMPGWMQKYGQRRVFQAALARTYTAWTAPNWEWVDSLFNEHFLTQQADSLLICYLEEGGSPEPVELAEAWAEQFAWFDEAMRQRYIVTLIPAVANFLDYLEAELSTYPFRSLYSKNQQPVEPDCLRQITAH